MDSRDPPFTPTTEIGWTTRRAAFWSCMILFVLAGILLRVGLAIRLPTTHRPDEVFQNLEPAYRLWTGRGAITWEWREGIRSWMFPDFIYLIMQATSLLHLPSQAALPAVWAAFSIFSSSVIVAGVWLGWRTWGFTGALLCGVLTAFWPDLVYFGPKTLAEVQAGNLLVIAAALASLGRPETTPQDWRRMAAIGAILGLAFDLRFQLSLALALPAIWAARLDLRRGWLPLLIGAAVPLAILGLIDWWTWGSPYQSIWKNIDVNLFEHKAQQYGTSPLGAYLVMIVQANGAATIPLLALFLLGARDAKLMAALTVVVIGFHSLIAHKEVSFVYAAIPCAVITIGIGAARLVRMLPRWLQWPVNSDRATPIAAALCLAATLFAGIAEDPFVQSRSGNGLQSLWGTAHAAPDLCGLGLYASEDFPWPVSPGYVGLNRNVPIYLIRSHGLLDQSIPGFNYVIADPADSRDLTGYEKLRCSSGYCILRRPGSCQPVAGHEFSEDLRRAGE